MIEYELVRSADRLGAIAEEVSQSPVTSLDLETTGFSPITSEVRLCSLNTGKSVYVIDVFETKTLGPVGKALHESKGIKVGQNLKFDQKFLLYKYGIELWPIFDTYRASALIHNGRGLGSDLWDLYNRELGIAPETGDLGGSDWSGPLTKEQLDYAAEDVIWLPKLREALKPKLKALGLNTVALIEFGAILPEAAIELEGFFLDREMWISLAESNIKKAEELRKQLVRELPHPANQISLPGFDPDFNLQSNEQLLKSLRRLGLKQSDGKPLEDTKEMTLAMYAKDFPIVSKILDYRGYAQSVKSFGIDYLDHIDPKTGRIHSSYFPFTGAGRYSCSRPNLQQVPRSKEFRKCFKVPKGRKLVISDYSQIELRIAAEISGDQTLIEIYKNGEDAHQRTASIVMSVAIDKVTKGMRQLAKPINFGLIYGLGAEKLVKYAQASYGVSMSLSEAESFRQRYFQGYSGVRSWHRAILSDENKRSGITHTIPGRLRYLKVDAHNEYMNSPVQGTGADGLKNALPLVYKRLKKYDDRARMVIMVHDEIAVEADDDPELLKAVQTDLEEAMVEGMQPFLKRVPVIVEGGVGESWAEK
jgi:DNA polymerase-1